MLFIFSRYFLFVTTHNPNPPRNPTTEKNTVDISDLFPEYELATLWTDSVCYRVWGGGVSLVATVRRVLGLRMELFRVAGIKLNEQP
jgi:hypothetical protein